MLDCGRCGLSACLMSLPPIEMIGSPQRAQWCKLADYVVQRAPSASFASFGSLQGCQQGALEMQLSARGATRMSWSRPALRATLSRAALSRAASAAAQPKPPLKYFSAWFCPFAHRATLALEHHADVVPYAWEESLGWEQRPPTGKENFEAEEREDWWYHWFRRSPPIAPDGGVRLLSGALLPAVAGNRQRC